MKITIGLDAPKGLPGNYIIQAAINRGTFTLLQREVLQILVPGGVIKQTYDGFTASKGEAWRAEISQVDVALPDLVRRIREVGLDVEIE